MHIHIITERELLKNLPEANDLLKKEKITFLETGDVNEEVLKQIESLFEFKYKLHLKIIPYADVNEDKKNILFSYTVLNIYNVEKDTYKFLEDFKVYMCLEGKCR